LPVIDLLKRYFKIADRNELREIREMVTGELLTLDRALANAVAVLALLYVPVDDTQWNTLELPPVHAFGLATCTRVVMAMRSALISLARVGSAAKPIAITASLSSIASSQLEGKRALNETPIPLCAYFFSRHSA
jgi:hypothetical protein